MVALGRAIYQLERALATTERKTRFVNDPNRFVDKNFVPCSIVVPSDQQKIRAEVRMKAGQSTATNKKRGGFKKFRQEKEVKLEKKKGEKRAKCKAKIKKLFKWFSPKENKPEKSALLWPHLAAILLRLGFCQPDPETEYVPFPMDPDDSLYNYYEKSLSNFSFLDSCTISEDEFWFWGGSSSDPQLDSLMIGEGDKVTTVEVISPTTTPSTSTSCLKAESKCSTLLYAKGHVTPLFFKWMLYLIREAQGYMPLPPLPTFIKPDLSLFGIILDASYAPKIVKVAEEISYDLVFTVEPVSPAEDVSALPLTFPQEWSYSYLVNSYTYEVVKGQLSAYVWQYLRVPHESPAQWRMMEIIEFRVEGHHYATEVEPQIVELSRGELKKEDPECVKAPHGDVEGTNDDGDTESEIVFYGCPDCNLETEFFTAAEEVSSDSELAPQLSHPIWDGKFTKIEVPDDTDSECSWDFDEEPIEIGNDFNSFLHCIAQSLPDFDGTANIFKPFYDVKNYMANEEDVDFGNTGVAEVEVGVFDHQFELLYRKLYDTAMECLDVEEGESRLEMMGKYMEVSSEVLHGLTKAISSVKAHGMEDGVIRYIYMGKSLKRAHECALELGEKLLGHKEIHQMAGGAINPMNFLLIADGISSEFEELKVAITIVIGELKIMKSMKDLYLKFYKEFSEYPAMMVGRILSVYNRFFKFSLRPAFKDVDERELYQKCGREYYDRRCPSYQLGYFEEMRLIINLAEQEVQEAIDVMEEFRDRFEQELSNFISMLTNEVNKS